MKAVKLLSNLLFVVLAAILVSFLFGFNPIVTFSVLAIAGALAKGRGLATMAVTKEIWETDIIGNLFKDNQFAERAVSGDQYVVAGKIVHIPTAGAPVSSLKNNTEFPITAVKRTDNEVLYALDNYYQPPKFVEKVEQYELSYDKRQSIMGEDQAQLIQDAMDGLLFRWAWQGLAIGVTPCNNIPTVGAATAATLPGATGNRKLFTRDVFSTIKKAMDKANIPANGRIALLTADHHQQLIDSFSDTALTNFYRFADIEKGIIGRFMGFDIYMRSTVQRWRLVGGVWTPVDEQDPAFAAGTGDSAASLFWQESCVERARGEVNVFDDAGRPEYYGDVFSMNMRLGGRQRRVSGVWAVPEDISA